MLLFAQRRLPVLSAVLLLTITGLPPASKSQTAKGAPPYKPLMLEQTEEMAPCQSTGKVMHLDPKGDNFLSVQSGPGGKPYVEKDRLHSGKLVTVCDETRGWYGVIYGPTDMTDCRYERKRNGSFEYTGPCKYGWVAKRYVEIIAG